MKAVPMNFTWHPTNAPPQTRYDDIWFITPQVGWAINGAGEILHTEDGFKTFTIQKTVPGDTWLRCMGFASPTDGWVGTLSRQRRLWRTQDGKTWTDMTPRLPPRPIAVCGLCSPSKSVVYASGTQFPDQQAGIMKTIDGGETWTSISMAAHANLLIDNFFTDDLHGWVVGGKGGTSYEELKPVVLFTADGGQSWENRLQNSGIDFPLGEWGWKIQFLNPQIGFVSLENPNAAAILKTADGGQTWKRIVVNDPQKNVDLEGVGFINEMVGWAGGWGHDFDPGPGNGITSGTTDGGATWFSANDDMGRFVNRFRFLAGSQPIAGYASGKTVYQCVATEGPAGAQALAARFRAPPQAPVLRVKKSLEIKAEVPENAGQLMITIFNRRQKLVKVLADEKTPRAGSRTFNWDFSNEEGGDSGTGHFIYRVLIDGNAESGMVVRAASEAPAAPADLPSQVEQMITRIAGIALRSHDELMLPDATGTPVTLKSLFHVPRELMAALVRGGWVIPGVADRSMFLTAIIGTGPMKGRLSAADIQLLTDWIDAGAVIPAAGS
jgi:photosystem II stability/assembly factor-like uncharacterized protein